MSRSSDLHGPLGIGADSGPSRQHDGPLPRAVVVGDVGGEGRRGVCGDRPGRAYFASTIIPAPTVLLVDSSTRMKPPVRRFLA